MEYINKSSSKNRTIKKLLSKALQQNNEELILLEGEPGSGKSVALRHIALLLAKKAKQKFSPNTRIPLYINLRQLSANTSQKINKQLIKNYVLQTILKSLNDDLVDFFKSEFDVGLKKGNWYFLFDSFDEIPEILSAPDGSETVHDYEVAINNFLSGYCTCKGIIASRYFRGAAHLRWSSFRIMRLSSQRKLELIKKAGLNSECEKKLITELDITNDEVRYQSGNPLFLSLLTEYVRTNNVFPESTYEVFECYIDTRLTKDETRIQQRFSINATQLRTFAVDVAFTMAVDTGIGLNPTQSDLYEAFQKHINEIDAVVFQKSLAALEFIKIGVSTNKNSKLYEIGFNFAHRRFQEYFSSCKVLENPELVPYHTLLTSGKWRESVVVMMQTSQNIKIIDKLVNSALQLLNDVAKRTEEALNNTGNFIWVDYSLHLLSLIQDGFTGKMQHLDLKNKKGYFNHN